jgi:uncharacterized membrane protein
VIAADGIPQNQTKREQSFLGVKCNAISFGNGYPEMDTQDGSINPDLFPQGYTDWQTVYLEGLDNTLGTVWDQGMELPFYGTVKNENIVMIGLNLPYFYALTGDSQTEELLGAILGLSSGELPERTIVPVELTITDHTITATVPESGQQVNLALSYHEIFSSDRNLTSKNHLLYVDGGTTVIRLKYPYLWQGAAMSLAGLILAIIYLMTMRKRGRESAQLLRKKGESEDEIRCVDPGVSAG